MRIPLLMMRTRSLCGPFFRKAFGSRSSHPLAHTQGNAISASVPGITVDLQALGAFLRSEGWSITTTANSISVDGEALLQSYLQGCDFSDLDGQLRHDVCEGIQQQGFCLGGGCP